jgi:hypothetical protein
MQLLSREFRKWKRMLSVSLQNLFGQHIIRRAFIYSVVNPAIHRQNQTSKKGLYAYKLQQA